MSSNSVSVIIFHVLMFVDYQKLIGLSQHDFMGNWFVALQCTFMGM